MTISVHMTVNMAIPKPLNADGIFMVGVQPDKIQIVCKKAGTDVSSLTVEKKRPPFRCDSCYSLTVSREVLMGVTFGAEGKRGKPQCCLQHHSAGQNMTGNIEFQIKCHSDK